MAAAWPAHWWDLPIAAIDVETTGLDATADRIIEIAVVHMRAGVVEERYCSLVNPGRPVGPDSERITGISDADVADAPPFSEIAAEVAQRLQGHGILAYNLGFDRAFVENELRVCELAWPTDAPLIDPLTLARGIFPEQRGFKLGRVAERLGIELVEAHRADHDAAAAGEILYAMRAHLPEGLRDLLELQSEWAQDHARRTANWRGGARKADPSLILRGEAADEDGVYRLGPAYRYSRDGDVDPLRFIFRRLPAGGSSR